MGQRKGQTGNPAGRTKGTPNKVTADMKDKIQLFISNNFEQLQEDFDAVEAKDRLVIYERLLKYLIPTKIEQENINPIESSEQIHIVLNGKSVNLSK